MQEAQRLRARIAKTLGYKNFAAEAIETKMAKTPEAVFKFLDDLKDKVRSAYGRHRRKLSCAKQFASGGKTGKDTCKLNSWDHSFYGQVITREDFKYDPQEVREYFPVDVVVAGVLEVYQKVLGLRFAEQKAPLSTKMWHPDLRWFNVTDASKSGEDYAKTSGAFVGEFVLDIFPRAGKYGHAMAATMQPGYVLPSGARQHPISAMVANLDPKRPGKPSLLSHGEVTTFFHEFGHVMHNLCSKTAFSSFSGTAVERDFVEAPSQMLEFWTWSPTVLRMISNKNPGGGGAPETFPEELLAKIKRARDSSEAAGDNGQLVLAYFDMLIHTDEHADVQATWAKVERDLGLSAVIKGTNRAASFGHMFGGYNAGYYGYLWSKVYAADMFSLFQAGEGPLDEALGHRYRNRILAPGGSRDAIDSLRDFLGREPNNHAFIKALGIEPNTPEFAAVEAMEKESTVMKGCTCGKEWETAIEDEGVVAEVAIDASGAVENFGANLKPVAAIADHLDSVVAELDTALGKIARKKMARVIEDYVALAGDQLSLSKGDVLEDVDVHTSQKGWYSGHKVGTAVPGIFPARMVEIVKTEKEAAVVNEAEVAVVIDPKVAAEVTSILGMGNPLLDISATVEQSVLDEWGATLNNAILAEEKHQPLYAKLCESHPVEYIAGGATLNSIRVAQWMLANDGKKDVSHYIGSIGKDEFGAKLKSQLAADGVKGHFLEVADKATGTCAVLVKDNERSLIANLSAAEKYDKAAHFDTPEVQAAVEAAGIYYMAGFPLTHEGGLATVKAICAHANEKGKKVTMNVSAPFLAEVPPLRAMLKECFAMCDVIFCNESEAVGFAKGEEWGTEDIAEIAAKLAALPGPKAGTRKAVVTQGADATVIATAGGATVSIAVAGNPWTLTKADLVDTNGAGDAFVGGFLYGMATGKTDAQCAEAGHFAAGTIIQRAGCTFPDKCDFKPKA